MSDWTEKPEEIQNGKAWLEWRKNFMGSSDAPIIVGESPWCTPYELWLQKTGKKESEFSGNWATERGHRLEGFVRNKVNTERGMDFSPKTFDEKEYGEHKLPLSASLDGFCLFALNRVGLEVKVCGQADHATAMSGKVPKKYMPQIVHQFIVGNLDVIIYASYYVGKGVGEEDGNLVLLDIERPPQMAIDGLIEKEREFWSYVRNDLEYPIGEKDFKVVKCEKFLSVCTDLILAKNTLDEAASHYEALKNIAIEKAKSFGHPKIQSGQVKISRVERKGNVDWKRVSKKIGLESAEIEEFRKPSTFYHTVSFG